MLRALLIDVSINNEYLGFIHSYSHAAFPYYLQCRLFIQPYHYKNYMFIFEDEGKMKAHSTSVHIQ